MADLVVLDFDGMDTADAVLSRLRLLRKQELIDLLDAVVVIFGSGCTVRLYSKAVASQRRTFRPFGAALGPMAR